MTTFLIPSEGRSPRDYTMYVSSLPWIFTGERALSIDYGAELVTAAATIDGFATVDPSTVVIAPARPVTRLAFRNRFTQAEKIGIYTAAETSAELRIFLDDVAAAEYVDLDDPATAGGVTHLEAVGLIAAGRAQEILA